MIPMRTASTGSAEPRGPHIVLVGLPGAGKSSVGVLLARLLDCPFLDFDAEIERRTAKTIREIFAAEGEDVFRQMERVITVELAGQPGMVLAPGGGWMAREGNVALLRPPARLIHLAVSVEAALARLGPETAQRPLLAGPDPASSLAALSLSRLPLYGMADAELETETLTPQEVALGAKRLASRWGWRVA